MGINGHMNITVAWRKHQGVRTSMYEVPTILPEPMCNFPQLTSGQLACENDFLFLIRAGSNAV
jgi:hypothetical protein